VADTAAARQISPTADEPEGKALSAASRAGEKALRLDRLIHERTRLAIVSALAVNPQMTFSELKQVLGVTDGNLSVHCRKLEEAGYITCKKTFAKRVPRTSYSLTTDGRTALERYLGHMEAVIRAARRR
jgi:DNA-binding MarR family transcriptional regulator